MLRRRMTLVVGATGRLGLEICRRLREAGDEVRAFVRPGAAGGARRTAAGRSGEGFAPGHLAPAGFGTPWRPLAPETTLPERINGQLGRQRLFAWMLGLLG